MAPGDSERQLGILIGKVDQIKERLDRSVVSRAGLHGRMDLLAIEVHDIKAKVTAIAADMNEMKPVVALVRGLKAKAGGAVVVLGAMGAIAAWLIEHFWEPIRAALMRMFH